MIDINAGLGELRRLLGDLAEAGVGAEAVAYVAEYVERGRASALVEEWLSLKEEIAASQEKAKASEEFALKMACSVAGMAAINGLIEGAVASGRMPPTREWAALAAQQEEGSRVALQGATLTLEAVGGAQYTGEVRGIQIRENLPLGDIP